MSEPVPTDVQEITERMTITPPSAEDLARDPFAGLSNAFWREVWSLLVFDFTMAILIAVLAWMHHAWWCAGLVAARFWIGWGGMFDTWLVGYARGINVGRRRSCDKLD